MTAQYSVLTRKEYHTYLQQFTWF